jgi:hypothetical protein
VLVVLPIFRLFGLPYVFHIERWPYRKIVREVPLICCDYSKMYKRVLGAPARAMARRAFSTTAVAQVSIAGDPERECERGRDAAKEVQAALRPRARCAPSPSRGACAQKEVVFVRGVRTPFVLSGGEFNDYMAYDLQVWNRCGRSHPPCTPRDLLQAVSACGAESGRAGQHGRVPGASGVGRCEHMSVRA